MNVKRNRAESNLPHKKERFHIRTRTIRALTKKKPTNPPKQIVAALLQ